MLNSAINYDICILGAGAGGLSVASGAAQLGLSVALIEGHKMGGDCLNYGCVPSKALLASAKHYYHANHSEEFGITVKTDPIIIKDVMYKVKEIIASIEPHDSIERFESLGVKVYSGVGHFISDSSIQVNDVQIIAKYFIIATGSSPVIPSIPGIEQINYLTNETIFDLSENPKHLIIIGGGPISTELSQAFLMLGIKVTVLSHGRILPKDEDSLVDELRGQMLGQGLNLFENIQIKQIAKSGDDINITIEVDGLEQTIHGSHVLVAAGRKATIDKLDLEKAQIKYNNKGIQVDDRLRTTNKKIFAIGDSIGGFQFTHIASYHAGIIIRNIIFRQCARVDYNAVPWVTYTYPELAHVGVLEKEAKQKSNDIKVCEFVFKENDRARAERALIGKIKLITTKKGRVLGVSILGANAGELLAPWIDLINRKETIKAITKNILPYPTLSEINKQVVGEYYKPLLFSNKVKGLVKFLKIFW